MRNVGQGATMDIPFWFEKRLVEAVDFVYALWPQSVSDKERLKHCKIVSHRGEHDNIAVFENTIAAFDRVKNAGVWGVEFDIRWTKDLHPVVFHDNCLQRVFRSNIEISKVTLSELKLHCTLIPSLAETIQKYGQTLHLMAEIKEEVYPDPSYQNKVLKNLFEGLSPQKDYHFLSLSPDMFLFLDFLHPSTFLPVARFNVRKISELALRNNYRGITGHYLLMKDTILKKHHKQRQRVGTGFVSSKNCLSRELNRGVEWIFSNNAVELQKICNSLLEL